MEDYSMLDFSMVGSRTIEVNPFTLYYVGFFVIEFEFENKAYSKILYLEPDMLFKIIENEGLKDNIELLEFRFKGVEFSKTTLLLEVKANKKGIFSFYHSELAAKQNSRNYSIDCEIKTDE